MGEDKTLTELWTWVDRKPTTLRCLSSLTRSIESNRILSSPTTKVFDYDFAYQGILGIWEGLPRIAQATPDLPPVPTSSVMHSAAVSPASSYRNLLDIPPSTHTPANNAFAFPGFNNESMNGGRKKSKLSSQRSRSPADASHGEFYEAVRHILARRGVSLGREKDRTKALWRPHTATNKLAQRRLALELCGWNLGDENLSDAITRYVTNFLYGNA
jgi:hypothetical protein